MKLTLEDIGREVYCIDYHHCVILKEVVLAIGDEYFIPEKFMDYTSGWQFISFNLVYSTLEEAKEELERYIKWHGYDGLKFEDYGNDSWGFEGDD